MNDLDELDALRAAATPTPWAHDPDQPDIVMKPDKPGSTWDGKAICTVQHDDFGLYEEADAAFIVAACNNIGPLSDELRQLRNRIAVEVQQCDYAEALNQSDHQAKYDLARRAEAAESRLAALEAEVLAEQGRTNRADAAFRAADSERVEQAKRAEFYESEYLRLEAGIRALADRKDKEAEESVARLFDGSPFPALVSTGEIRALLTKGGE